MSEIPDSLYTLINRTGNVMKTAAGTTVSPSALLFVDANSAESSGNIPFTVPLFAGVTSTSASVVSIEGSSTGTAADAMHLTLVQGAAGSLTTAGFLRVTITDDAGNLTNGQYYIPFGTLA